MRHNFNTILEMKNASINWVNINQIRVGSMKKKMYFTWPCSCVYFEKQRIRCFCDPFFYLNKFCANEMRFKRHTISF